MVDRISRFEDLEVWLHAQEIAVLVYEITKRFPDDERFGLTSQIRRAVASVSANIAEGFGRYTTNDKLHFYVIAYGSLLETKNFIYLAQRLGFLETATVDEAIVKIMIEQKQLNAFIRAHREKS